MSPEGVPTPVEVDKFLAENDVDEGAAGDLRSCPGEIQRIVLSRGDLSSARNASAALIARIRDARTSLSSGNAPHGGSYGVSDPSVEAFLNANNVDESAAASLRSSPPDIQRTVLARGDLVGTRNPSSALLSRIRDAKAHPPQPNLPHPPVGPGHVPGMPPGYGYLYPGYPYAPGGGMGYAYYGHGYGMGAYGYGQPYPYGPPPGTGHGPKSGDDGDRDRGAVGYSPYYAGYGGAYPMGGYAPPGTYPPYQAANIPPPTTGSSGDRGAKPPKGRSRSRSRSRSMSRSKSKSSPSSSSSSSTRSRRRGRRARHGKVQQRSKSRHGRRRSRDKSRSRKRGRAK
uniref:Uncharacterized protein n=1 Tax=Noctiluca scintillans TaxID=2966 RepID=A0A7S1F0D1_NOCSC|mmetsp:Transcript_22085/g.58438  ORF Transcript_22085/g.58438 Transcript_22085/m.58438 type:complete len:341 (+) Transcript_22085:67-1089(+)